MSRAIADSRPGSLTLIAAQHEDWIIQQAITLLDDPVFVLGGDQGERLRAGVGDGKRHGEPPMDEIGGRLPQEGKPSGGRWGWNR